MVKLRHPLQDNKLNELNRLVWLGLLLLVSGSAAVLVATNFLSEPLLSPKNYILIAILLFLLIVYIFRLVRMAQNLFRSKY